VLRTSIEAREISKSFGGPPLFSGLSVSVESGLLAVAGRNGSGKTTLLKILASLLRPGSGIVRVLRGGDPLAGDERRLAVGWAGPDLAFYDDFSARENLEFFRRAAGRDTRGIGALLQTVGLDDRQRRVGAFSTGMKQRLRVAFSLLFDPPILVLDEPSSNLDEEGRSMVRSVIAERRRRGAVVLASNDPRDFAEPDQTIRLGPEK
jgi:ABC-type multidrug transport system ATPase subunit